MSATLLHIAIDHDPDLARFDAHAAQRADKSLGVLRAGDVELHHHHVDVRRLQSPPNKAGRCSSANRSRHNRTRGPERRAAAQRQADSRAACLRAVQAGPESPGRCSGACARALSSNCLSSFLGRFHDVGDGVTRPGIKVAGDPAADQIQVNQDRLAVLASEAATLQATVVDPHPPIGRDHVNDAGLLAHAVHLCTRVRWRRRISPRSIGSGMNSRTPSASPPSGVGIQHLGHQEEADGRMHSKQSGDLFRRISPDWFGSASHRQLLPDVAGAGSAPADGGDAPGRRGIHSAADRPRINSPPPSNASPRARHGQEGPGDPRDPDIGGCGSTTVACNVAAALAKTGKTVLVDLDLVRGGVASYFDIRPRYTIADVMDSGREARQALLDNALAIHQSSGLAILARPDLPEDTQRVKPPGFAGCWRSGPRSSIMS